MTQLHEVESYVLPGLKVFDKYFEVPLDHNNENGEKIRIFARQVLPLEKSQDVEKLPFIVYLQGGPGFECRLPSNSGWMKAAFDKGYQVLLLDQRGTGLSTAINTTSLEKFSTAEEKAEYLRYFRADSIIKDCEIIRKELLKDRDNQKWSLLGQSFGGFCITTYLSLFPESLEFALITGGVPPLVNNPDSVYQRLYKRVIKRNQQYYQKYPKDVSRVRAIVEYLASHPTKVPNGGDLTVRRFQQLGLFFGFTGGFDTVHQVVLTGASNLETLGKLSYKFLENVQELQSFDTNNIYAILHESIYCQGESHRWAAERVRAEYNQFESNWDAYHNNSEKPVYFTGEMVYSWMFDDYAELRPLKEAAEITANYESWGPLYDENQLRQNTVPVAAVSYYNDMFVDVVLSEQTANTIKGMQQWITNKYHHNGLREDGYEIFNFLYRLKNGDVDI
ncbi:alpha/beta-hydrolase [Basidiobolus meristosporus CBS 931.73]|uniref:Alpha/beta-hydrolase n=1 Tax=Basidiobolus meristosporus CBS 931.73 TaxID=1314790 RepID=A0A1Y1YXR8_9FUNG|nr:alpha/beta-hydrolase [Basidiobolus meristosporus CBS 931.73]|eukprot:ORY02823.1 alpha/beta-hydrolase [Basidiobolus meristosporus CBS 931.73]